MASWQTLTSGSPPREGATLAPKASGLGIPAWPQGCSSIPVYASSSRHSVGSLGRPGV